MKNKTTIAVLPFNLNSNDDSLNTLILGFTDDLITSFSKFVGLSVISQFSTLHIKDLSNQKEIDKLEADFLIIGRIRLLDKNLRISIQLVKTEDKSVVFAANHDESIDSILETQDKMVKQIVSVLRQKMNYNILSYSYKKNTVALDAYENWLRGMDFLKNASLEGDVDARKHFKAALKIDPHYALAYTGLSLSYFNEWSCHLWDRWDASHKGAHKYAIKAIELDENDYTALAVLGRTYWFKGEFDNAEHCLRKSLRMNPNDARNLITVAFTMCFLGYFDESIQLFLKACELNPIHKEQYYSYGVVFYFEAGDFEKCIELYRQTNVKSVWTDYPGFIAAVHFHLSDFDKMWKYWTIYLELFEKHVYSGKGDLETEALKWQIDVNLYKNETKLTPFWNYIKENKHLKTTLEENYLDKNLNSLFIQREDMWELNFQGLKVLLKDVKGFHDIRKLLTEPKKEFHCMELMKSNLQDNLAVETIDQQAKENYQKRIRELQIEIEDAEEMNNTTAIFALQEEYDAILDHLSQSMGLAGKTRNIGSSVEKARSAITWRLRSAIKKIENPHPKLANHLTKSIKTGTLCSYSPEIDVEWIV